MRIRASLVVGALLVVLVSSHLAAGQGFQGGLRGSLKDAGGVVPGVEVTLTNEQTNIKRSTVTNERGEYVVRQRRSRATTRSRRSLQGYKTDRSRRHPHRHAAVPHARPDAGGRRDRREHHRHRRSAAHRDGERLAGHGARLRGAADAAGAGPRRVPRSASRSRRSSRRATASSTGSRIRPTRRCCRSAAARAAATTTRSTACRSPTSPTARSPTRPSRRSTTSRCRCTPTTRRWAAPAAACSTRR